MTLSTPKVSRRWSAQVLAGAVCLIALAWVLGPGLRQLFHSTAVEQADSTSASWLYGATGPAMHQLLIWVSWAHGTVGILVLACVFAVATWRHATRSFPLVLLAAVPGGLLLNVAVKHAVMRARPARDYTFEMLHSYSFPSGHTAGATLLYGFVATWLWPRVPSTGARLALLAAAMAMVALVAVSRIVLGMHFLSDCIAAVVEATAWLAVCLVAADTAERVSATRLTTP